MALKPEVKFLSENLIRQIIAEAKDILGQVGIKIFNHELLTLVSDHGAYIDKSLQHARLSSEMIDKALNTVPSSFKLYDVQGKETHDFSGTHVYFTPASSALNILAGKTPDAPYRHREPNTDDYIRYVKVAGQLDHIASQSTAFIPADVDENISDSYRLYLNLLYGEKPVVTGTFSDKGFKIMRELLEVVRGSAQELKEKPLAIFSCCSTTPLKWGKRSCHDIVNCARAGIPVELIAMPLTGFTAPVTLVGALVGHTAETLSGIVLHQLVAPGAPLLYGGAASAFDMKYGTTPLGAIESQMMACAYNEIGKYLGIPTQAYIALSDAKTPDYQAGLETSMGAVMAAFSGINSISGPGMLDFVNCFSLEKLVLDNEICGMIYRMIKGIEPKEDIPTLPLYKELLKEEHLLTSQHTMHYFKKEHYFPGKVIDRYSLRKWKEQGEPTTEKQAPSQVEHLVNNYRSSSLNPDIKKEMTAIMEKEAKRYEMNNLPQRNDGNR